MTHCIVGILGHLFKSMEPLQNPTPQTELKSKRNIIKRSLKVCYVI